MSDPPTQIRGLLTASAELQGAVEVIARVAPTPASVLILGETGTGKELLARALHEGSGRKGRFVPVDCGALPEPLVEALLFGHTRGAFTGASASGEGLFRHAHEGTLFLDEVGNLPAPAQLSLLRVLQERRIRPVGSADEVAIDVRVVAATSEALDGAVAEGRFREDLLYRLDVIRVEVPPLRRRPEDVALLFDHFLASHCERHGVSAPRVHADLRDALATYDWPGNVRQLENLVERLVLTRAAVAGELRATDLDLPGTRERRAPPATAPMVRSSSAEQPALGARDLGARDLGARDLGARDLADGAEVPRLARTLEEAVDVAERAYLERLLEEHAGRMDDAARAGGVSRRTLQRKLKKHGLDRRAFDDGQGAQGLWLTCPPFAPLRLGSVARTVGRDPTCDLCLPHTQVSRLHLELEPEGEQVFARDAGSTNGTLLNGAPLAARTALSPGDELEVGVFQLTVVEASSAEDEGADETGRLGSVRVHELAPGRLVALVDELCAAGVSATLQVRPRRDGQEAPGKTAGGLWVSGGTVVRAWAAAGLQGEEARRHLEAIEVGTCHVSEFAERVSAPGQG